MGKVYSFAEKYLEKTITKARRSRCSICNENTHKVSWVVEINNTIIHNAPHNLCPNCGHQYIDDDVINAIEMRLNEEETPLEEYTIPTKYTKHYFEELDLSY